ncbi:arylamine N-acetyltransferase [Streptomyces scabiei]|uniref:arylamine N-acetyltransferase family protein n=1 Tax=Streptomyces scabiei TaxID=1930 RepID=UPI0029AB5AE8|nr:arylamine N-acetyltransferase [Streptomyces scabiei]MDX3118296.1 arylamine N-acetyltransferase [Streptomyces scabiei]
MQRLGFDALCAASDSASDPDPVPDPGRTSVQASGSVPGSVYAPTADLLRELHLRHLRAVPFENLSVHLGEEIVLEERRLVEKVVEERRGGFCYELNGAFGALLAALGFEVTLLAARVYGEQGRLGIPYDHLALLVRTADAGEWLADVGFGAHSHYPLQWGRRDEQPDPAGVFRIVESGPHPEGPENGADASAGRDLDVVLEGAPVYRLEARPRVLRDFVAGAWWHSTSPESHFTKSLVCSRLTDDGGRTTLSGRRLKVTTADGVSRESELTDDEEVLQTYRERFGITLERVPAVRTATPRADGTAERGTG